LSKPAGGSGDCGRGGQFSRRHGTQGGGGGVEKSESSLAAAQRIALLGSWELELETVNGSQISWSDETYRIFGLEPRQWP